MGLGKNVIFQSLSVFFFFFFFFLITVTDFTQLLPPEIVVKLFRLVRLSFVISKQGERLDGIDLKACRAFLKRCIILSFQTVVFLIF